MKVLKQTPTTLHIKLPAFYLLGCFTMAFALLLLGLGPTTVHLEGAKDQSGTVNFTISKRWLGLNFSETTIDGVVGAVIETSTHRDKDTRSRHTIYRAALKTETWTEPVTSGWSRGGASAQRIVDRVGQFVGDPSMTSLSINLGGKWWMTLIGLFILLVTAQLLLDRVHCVIDGPSRQVIVRRGGVFGRGNYTFDLIQVDRFEVEQKNLAGDKSGKVYRVALKLRSGDSFPFRYTWTNEWKSKKAAVKRLNQFLQRTPQQPVQVHDPVSQEQGDGKICSVCGADCSGAPRVQDRSGQYCHVACYEAAHGVKIG